MTEQRKFIGLQINNLRKIHMAEMDFDGKNLIPIYGANGAGKSTVLLALEILLHGKDALPEQAITKGQETASLIGKLNGYEIHRKIKPDGTILTQVKTEQGATMPSPQAFLDSIAGKLVDPEYLSKLSGPLKKEMLIKYAGIDFAAVDAKIKALRDERTLKGREVKYFGELTMVPKVEPVNLPELLKKRVEMGAFNDEQKAKQDKIRTAEGFILGLNMEIEVLEKELQKKKDILTEAMQRKSVLPAAEPEKDLTGIDEEIAAAENKNAQAREYETYCEKKKLKDAKEAEYKDLNEKIAAAEKEKEDIFKTADLPLKGELEITDTGLSYNDINDSNWSDAESIKICCMIAAHFSKDLKAMYIRRGESLDSKSLKELKDFAEENDFQIFIEIVSENKEHDEGFYLEEGEIVIDFSTK